MSRNRAAPSGKRENVPEFLRAVYAGNNSPNGQDKVLAAFDELQDNEDRNQDNAMDDPTGEHPYSWSVAEEPDNRELNRYSNILPYNQTRVLLAPIRDPDTGAIIHGDYINASWVRPPGGIRSYIATQGPLKRTIVDFWRMVWQEKVRVLVMLTDVYERGKVKCNVYWPERVGDVISYDTAGLQIKLLSEEKALNGEAVLRRMEITRRPPILNTTSSSSSSSNIGSSGKSSGISSLTSPVRSSEDSNRATRPPRRSKDLGPPDQSSILLKDLRAPAIRLAPPPPRAPPARLGAHLQLSDQQPPTTAGLTEAMDIPNKRINSGINKVMGLSGSAPTAPPANFMLAKPPLPRKMKANKNLTLNTANTTANTNAANITTAGANTHIDKADNSLQNKNITLPSINTNINTATNVRLSPFSKLKSGSAPEPVTTTNTLSTAKSMENIAANAKPNKTQAAANLFRGIGDWFTWLTRVNNAQGQHDSTKLDGTHHSTSTASMLTQPAIERSSSLPAGNVPCNNNVHQDLSTGIATNNINSSSNNNPDQKHMTTSSADNNSNHGSGKSKLGSGNTRTESSIKPVQLTASQARNRMSAPPASAPLPDFSSIFTRDDDDDVLMSPPPASAAVHDDKPDPSMLSPMIVHDQDPTAALEATAALASGEYHGHDNMGALAMSLDEHLGDEPAVQRAIITQIHFLGWPDHGVPEQPDGVLRLVRLVNREQGASDSSGPVVVHCSAGCGRTGTFCVIDSAIAILTATRDGSVDLVHQLTRHFRTQRCTMVQTSQQYWFCYVAVLRRILTMLQRNRSVSL